MTRRKAPVGLTGGSGFWFEDQLAARLLLDMLAGYFPLGVDFGRLTRLHWQAHEKGWLFDDLVGEFDAAGRNRTAGLSIKSDRQVTENGFPKEFGEAAWTQVLGLDGAHALEPEADAIVLVVGQLANSVDAAWTKLLRESLAATAERMLARLAPTASSGAQSSARERTLFESLRCPSSLRRDSGTDDVATLTLVRAVRVLSFDYAGPTSRDEGQALVDAQAILRDGALEDARSLWTELTAISSTLRAEGGSLDMPQLLQRLGRFQLREHPDFRSDWASLHDRTRDAAEDVRSRIEGLPALPREADAERVHTSIHAHGACLLTGESGAGKSALAKALGESQFDRLVWLGAEDIEEDRHRLQTRLGLMHPLDDVLSSARERVLLVVDGAERLSTRSTKALAKTVRDLHGRAARGHVGVLLTGQGEAAARIAGALRDGGLPDVDVVALERPSDESIRTLLANFSGLKWPLLRPEVRPALRNLKVLEWVVQAVQRGEVLDEAAILNVSALIELLWRRWVETDDGNLGRSEALMRVAVAEAETLGLGVARTALRVDAAIIGELTREGLLRLRNERVSFSHDLLGDWARLRVLIGEVPGDLNALRSRADKPRWHRAIRLYGQWVVDQQAGNPSAWLDLMRGVDDGTNSGTISRDLLLEAAFLASNAEAVLESVWPTLIADDGRLLANLLSRFLYVATVPDPTMATYFRANSDAKEVAHLFRVPLATYWGAVLRTLNRHSDDVSRLVPDAGADVAKMWLRWTLPAIGDGKPIAWRSEAASLALRVATRLQTALEVEEYLPSKENKPLFEALLYAAPDQTDDVGQLCLELCYRRPLGEHVAAEKARAAKAREERRKPRQVDARYAYLTTSLVQRGPVRAPWSHGPSRRVSDGFAEACLDAGAFAALAWADADVAREVLLAICIEEPKEDDPNGYHSPREDLGLKHWGGGYPAMYFRGPFLRFLRDSPDQGLTFVLTLVNFATERWCSGFARYARHHGHDAPPPGIEFALGVGRQQWAGDGDVYQWHYSSPTGNGAIPCALMALEYWLHERIDAGDDVTKTIERIMTEGRSLAFAGLLLDVGKRHPELLVGPMRALLTVWQLYQLDCQIASGRSSPPELIGWEGEVLAPTAVEWYRMPHRARLLRDVVAELALTRGDLQDFFRETREAWSQLLVNDEPEVLRLLIERLNPASYVRRRLRDGTPVLVPQWPEHIAHRHAVEGPALERSMEAMTLPWRCRKWLDGEEVLAVDEVPHLWDVAQRVSREIEADNGVGENELNDPRSVLYGIVATLVVLHPAWIGEDPRRDAWCRESLERALATPLQPRVFAEPALSLERGFDAFAAEAGAVLLARDRNDSLARRLVAAAATSMRPNVITRVMARAFRERAALGDDFQRLQALVTKWSGARGTIRMAEYLQHDADQSQGHRRELEASFADRSLGLGRPALSAVDAAAAAEQEDLVDEREDSAMGRRRRPPARISLDAQTLMAGFRWLDVGAASTAEEQTAWTGFLEEALHLALAAVPREDPAHHGRQRHGVPGDFDTWVLEYIARASPLVDDATAVRLWRPILALGPEQHHWVETYLRRWTASASQTAPSVRRFAEVWRAMISSALEDPAWEARGSRDYDLARIVRELLGLSWPLDKTSAEAQVDYAAEIAAATPLFARAAKRWFRMPYVAEAFVNLATQKAGQALLRPGLVWLDEAVAAYGKHAWDEKSLTDALVRFLRAAWERERRAVVSDPACRKPFESLLAILSARGSHAAQNLRDELLDSAHDAHS